MHNMYLHIYIYIWYPRPVPRLHPVQVKRLVANVCCVTWSLHLWDSKRSFTMAPEASKFSVWCIFISEVSPNSWNVLEILVNPTISMICLWGIMEIDGFTNISNNVHDSRNYGSGSRGFRHLWKLLEMLVKPTISMICLWGIMEIVGFTNNFQQFP